jgi:alpha-L-rhamnosidase
MSIRTDAIGELCMNSIFRHLAGKLVFFLVPFASLGAVSTTTVTDLRCDYLTNPLGIDDTRPRLSWQLESPARVQSQTAYEILVASSPELLGKNQGDEWDTGRIASDETLDVAYGGARLRSGMRYYWKVRIWDKDKSESPWSGIGWFETGLLETSDWEGKWIGWRATMAIPDISLKRGIWIWYPGENALRSAPPGTRYFRKTFTIPADATIRQAWFAGTADNEFTFYVNGHVAGGGKDWSKAGYIELTPWLHSGLNCLAVEAKNDDQSPAGFLGKINILFDNHAMIEERTSRAWKASNREQDGWRKSEFDDSSWPNAEEVAAYGYGPWGSPALTMPPDQSPLPAPMLRKEFVAHQPVTSARFYICGLGLYDAHLNGRAIGDSVLNPAETTYDKRVFYNTYDITPLVKAGTNCIAVELGRGFYDIREETPWDWNHAAWRSAPKLICQINLTFADGTTAVVPSDSSWMLCVDGPERADSIYWGENYDSRHEKPGWTSPGCDDSGFTNVSLVSPPNALLQAQEMPPIKIVESTRPISVSEPKPDDYVFDAGFVTAGWAKFSASCPSGTQWTIRYGEKLDKDGTVRPYNLNDFCGPAMTDVYTFKGDGMESWEPAFSYKGFRYVEIIGSPVPLTTSNLEIRVVHSVVKPLANFECSNPLFNTLHQNAARTILNNLHGVPADPAYEKNGWMGDANVIAETTLFDFDMTSFYEKWTTDMRDCMSPGGLMPQIVPTGGWGMCHSPEWNSAYVFILWHLYEYCGDSRILLENYPALKIYAAYEIRQLNDYISNSCLNDWGSPDSGLGMCAPEGGALTSTAYTYRALELISQIASLLGQAGDAEYYARICARIQQAFNSHFFDPGTGAYHTDISAGYRQTSNILPVVFGLTPANQRETVLDNLVADIQKHDDHLDTGILGTKYLLPLLTESGEAGLAYSVADQKTYPSWGWWVANGATTMWEGWQLDCRSRDLYFFGTVDEWFLKCLAGIQPDPTSPGFKHFLIRPAPISEIHWVSAHYDSVRGRIVSEWKKKNGKFALHVIIPPNTTATVYLPTDNLQSILESGQPVAKSEGVTFSRIESGDCVFDVESGDYSFEVK